MFIPHPCRKNISLGLDNETSVIYPSAHAICSPFMSLNSRRWREETQTTNRDGYNAKHKGCLAIYLGGSFFFAKQTSFVGRLPGEAKVSVSVCDSVFGMKWTVSDISTSKAGEVHEDLLGGLSHPLAINRGLLEKFLSSIIGTFQCPNL